jgi:SAM-dependent methyltransferase
LGEFEAYVQALRRSQNNPSMDLNAAPRIRLKALSPALRERIQGSVTQLIAPWARRRARALARQPLRLHLGSGPNRREGWVNIDLVGLPIDLAWDLRKGIPFPEGSADAVFHEHLLEHLPLGAVLPLLRECRRVLRTGGVLRIGVPDAERYIRDYVQPNGFIDSFRPGRPTPLLALAETAYCYGHLSLWDGSTLCLALAEAGFEQVTVRAFGDSSISPAPDGANRKVESVYAEGVKA